MRVASHYTSEDLSELLWLDGASCFVLVLPIPYVQAAILNQLNPTCILYEAATAFLELKFCRFFRKYLAQELWQYLLTSKTIASSDVAISSRKGSEIDSYCTLLRS